MRPPHEVVVRKEHGNGRFQVGQLLAESKGKPRKSFHYGSNRQVMALDVTGAYRPLFALPYAEYPLALGPDHFRRSVAARLIVVSVILDDLAILGGRPEGEVNSLGIGCKAVCADLRDSDKGRSCLGPERPPCA